MLTNPGDYVSRARTWIRREGTPFNAYVTQDLASFFDEGEVAPDVFGHRRDKFREQLQAALGASEPLVKLNPTLLRLVHDKAINEATSLVFSSIPFKEGTEMYAVTKQVLGSMGFWDDAVSESWFQDASADGIEVFAMSGFPYQPIVMDSVMEPIAQEWMRQSNTLDSREAFWRFKRSRLLGEAIPADPTIIDAMIRGWYVAKCLSRLKVTPESGERGRGSPSGIRRSARSPTSRIRSWTPATRTRGFPGVVMQSLTIALALCNTESPSNRSARTKSSRDSAGRSREMSDGCSPWVQEGRLSDGAPTPDTSRAGAAPDRSPHVRRR